jgi:hypothetical protein
MIFPLAGSEVHPSSCTVGTGDKRSRGVTLTTNQHQGPKSGVSRSYAPLPLAACMAVAGQICLCSRGLDLAFL